MIFEKVKTFKDGSSAKPGIWLGKIKGHAFQFISIWYYFKKCTKDVANAGKIISCYLSVVFVCLKSYLSNLLIFFRDDFCYFNSFDIPHYFLMKLYSPMICTISSLWRGWVSKSMNMICCQVPRVSFCLIKGIVIDGPSSAALT